jgi:hypothetical protein
MRMPIPGSDGVSRTVRQASWTVALTANDPQAFEAAVGRMREGTALRGDWAFLNPIWTCMGAVHNFFDTAAVLLRRNLADREILFATLAQIIITAYDALEVLISLDQTVLLGSPLFRQLAEDARAYRSVHPDRFLHLPEAHEG